MSRFYPIGIALLGVTATPLHAEYSEGEKLFSLHVQSVLAEKCHACHSPDPDKKLKGELDLTTRESLLQGGESGAIALVPGDAAASLLHLATTWDDPDYEMPPKEADRLSGQQVGYLREWIDAGAPWPDDEKIAAIRSRYAEGVPVATSGALSEDWANRHYKEEDLWPYQPVQKTTLPEGFTGNPIDHFVGGQLSAAGLEPAPRAEPATFFRRLTYSLTGLPPTPEAAAQFRFRDLVSTIDDLLASPHYGEHFARHWLDVVRYADSAGFANDYERPHAWRYRDYVVRAFNNDKPYDRFVREQLAGDEISPSDPEMLIATGFLRMGPWEHTGMSVFRITRQQWLDDVTSSFGQTFLAHALQCASCHDHKFDPVPTKDYYRIQANFATTQFAERPAKFLPEENTGGFGTDRKYLQAKLEFYSRDGDEAELLKESAGENNPEAVGRDAIARKNKERLRWESDRTEPYALSVFTGNTHPVKNVSAPVRMPENPMAKGEIEKTHILTGGDPMAPSDAVTPGVLSAAADPTVWDSIPTTPAGRRLALSGWVTGPGNPLTNRVVVNRVWAWHFGQGIAGNPNNFGSTGKKPTHPELLDFLAAWFVENGSSIKKLSALITTSEAYARSAEHPTPDELDQKDPNRTLYAVFLPRRLSSEELRDSMLAVSGELNRELGGIPVRPDINPEVALQPRQVMGAYAPAYEPDPTPERRNRRSLYARQLRGLRDPFMETFNQPGPNASCELRAASTVTPQAFTLINGQETHERALAFAQRATDESDTLQEAVARAFRLAYAREPAEQELGLALAHLAAVRAHQQDRAVRATLPGTTVTRSAIDEKSGQPFEFVERLPVYEDYIPDLQPADVTTEVRALADLCLVLFNSNEFAYVY